jgi:hypothetical protein
VATWNDLFDASLNIIGVLDAGGTGATADRTFCLGQLNRMFGTWGAEVGPIYEETLDSVTWASGNATRTIGSGGNLNVARPQQILGASYRVSDQDYPLDLITHQEYQAITDKATTSDYPTHLAYNPTFASSLGNLLIWPVPSTSLALRLNSLKPLTIVSDQTATVALPPGWEDAIVYNLAQRIASAFGKSVKPEDAQMAIETKAAIVRINDITQPMWPDPMAPGLGYNSERDPVIW